MFKSKWILFSFIAAATLGSLFATTANAQALKSPTAQETQQARTNGPCRDPWVTIALTYRRLGTYAASTTPTFIAGRDNWGECETTLYNGGSWSSFDELAQAVQKSLSTLSSGGFHYEMTNLGGGLASLKGMNDGVQAGLIKLKLVGNSGGTLITNDGGTLVASGGGNLTYKVQSTATEKRIYLGKSVVIIRK